MTQAEEHAHEHRFIDAADTTHFSAYEQWPHGAISIRMHHRGFTLDLTIEEAEEFCELMAGVAKYLRERDT